jgi:hypothetical protein
MYVKQLPAEISALQLQISYRSAGVDGGCRSAGLDGGCCAASKCKAGK